MKDVLLNRSGTFWLAIKKFLYFGGVALLSTIPTSFNVWFWFDDVYNPSTQGVFFVTVISFTWYLFLFLLPFEAYKAWKTAAIAIEEMQKEKDRADKFAHGFKFQQVAEAVPAPASTPFIVDRGEDPTIDMERLPTPWQTDPQWKKKEAERPTIGFVQGVRARANSSQTESVQAWCKRNGIKY